MTRLVGVGRRLRSHVLRREPRKRVEGEDGHVLAMSPAATAGIAGTALAVYCFASAAPRALGMWELLALLAFLGLSGVFVHAWRERLEPSYRVLGPLAIFSLVFVGILLVRAVPLALGFDGRYFAVSSPSGHVESVWAEQLEQDRPELGRSVPRPATSDPLRPARLRIVARQALAGSHSIELSYTAQKDGWVALELPGPVTQWVPVAEGERVAASVGVRAVGAVQPGSSVMPYVRFFGAGGGRLVDLPLDGHSGTALRPGRWLVVSGHATAPTGAVSADLVVLVGHARDGREHRVLLDAPLVLPGVSSTADYLPGRSAWANSFVRALAIAIAFLAAVLFGYLLPFGDRLARRMPRLVVRDLRSRGESAALLGMVLVAIVAWYLEMRAYGGYRGYLDALRTIGVGGLGKWYLHALAILPTGAAVAILAIRIHAGGFFDRWRALELTVLLVGLLVALSYWLKTVLAIPLLTVLLLLYFRRRRAGPVLWGAAAIFILLTPFVYLVRGEGRADVSALVSGSYWHDFAGSASSRFFHFESLMIATRYGASEHPWQPAVDFVVTAVPRAFWAGKPLSEAARFTHAHLVPGLHTPEDVGVISLPGIAWLLGGSVAVFVVAAAIGVALRFTQGQVSGGGGIGNLLLGAGLLTFLLFLNDGWGLASSLIQVLISSAGWLVFLRPGREGQEP
jgi:hypothetical protein